MSVGCAFPPTPPVQTLARNLEAVTASRALRQTDSFGVADSQFGPTALLSVAEVERQRVAQWQAALAAKDEQIAELEV